MLVVLKCTLLSYLPWLFYALVTKLLDTLMMVLSMDSLFALLSIPVLNKLEVLLVEP